MVRTNNCSSIINRRSIGICGRVISRFLTQTCSGADAARSSRPKFRHAFITSGCRSRVRVKDYGCFRELLAIGEIEVSQECEGKFLTVDLLAYGHFERCRRVLKLGGEIVAALAHVDSDSDHSQMRR